MVISIGSDHAGRLLKNDIIKYLTSNGHIVYDCGTYTDQSVDYPDYCVKVCQKVISGEANMGLLVCYTGIGMSMAANKFKGIRAALVSLPEDAVLTREHNNANVLCLSGKNTSELVGEEIVEKFINTSFLGGRHERRVNKIGCIENEQ